MSDKGLITFCIVGGVMLGFVAGIVFCVTSHKSSSHRKPSVEHCIRIGVGQDYRDIECPSGTYRLYGDTLRVRLHT